MSNEIALNMVFRVNNGYTENISLNGNFTQNTALENKQVVSVPTTATTYTFSNLSTYGWMFLQNLDSTNYVTYGLTESSTYYPFGRMEAGEVALFRLNPSAPFTMQANTAAVSVSMLLLND